MLYRSCASGRRQQAILRRRRNKPWRHRARPSSLSLPAPMSSMSQRMIRGWFMGIPSWRGRVGIRIREFGLAARTSHSDSASESVGSEVSDGAGVTGDSIGTTDTQSTTTRDTSPGATRSITGATFSGVEVRAAELLIIPEQLPGPSAETHGLLADTLNPAARAASARAPSVTTTMEARKGAFRRVGAPASVAAEVFMEGAGAGNRSLVMFLADREI